MIVYGKLFAKIICFQSFLNGVFNLLLRNSNSESSIGMELSSHKKLDNSSFDFSNFKRVFQTQLTTFQAYTGFHTINSSSLAELKTEWL
jgi:hypothetical protein